MKALFILFFSLAFTLTAYADIGLVNRSANIKYDGSVDASTEEKRFINVINNEGGTIAAGSLVIMDVTVDDGTSVVVDNSASQTPHCIMVAACSDNKLCKCQTYGRYSSALYASVNGNAVAGAPFFNSTAAAGYIGEVVLGGVEIPGGIFLDAASATGAVEVFIKME